MINNLNTNRCINNITASPLVQTLPRSPEFMSDPCSQVILRRHAQ